MENFISGLSGKSFPITERIQCGAIRPTLLSVIRKEHPALGDEQYIAMSELNQYREKYMASFLQSEIADLSDLEKTVLHSIEANTLLTDKLDTDDTMEITVGQRLADNVAKFGGSWRFIIMFGLFLGFWILLNAIALGNKGYDPYPFILLNLILSCIAAIQAPLIMMSQNRQEEKDRQRSKKDYMINLKSEMEIRLLHEKLDHLIMHQQQKLLEIQQFQIEMMSDIYDRLK